MNLESSPLSRQKRQLSDSKDLESAKNIIKDSYMKLSEAFMAHLSFLKDIPVSNICSKEYFGNLESSLNEHVGTILLFLNLHQQKIDATLKIERELDSILKTIEKPQLRISSESFLEQPHSNTTKAPVSSQGKHQASTHNNTGSGPGQYDPSANFIHTLLSDESDSEKLYQVYGKGQMSNKISSFEPKKRLDSGSMPSTQELSNSQAQTEVQLTPYTPTTSNLTKMSLLQYLASDIQQPIIEMPVANIQQHQVNYQDIFQKSNNEENSQDDEEKNFALGNPLSEVHPRVHIKGIRELLAKGMDFYGSHTTVKIKRDLYFHGYLKKSRYIHSIIHNLDEPEKAIVTKLDFKSPVYNYVNFKGMISCFFLETGQILIDFSPQQILENVGTTQKVKTYDSKETFKTWYTVGKTLYPSTGRAICIGNNKLYFINQKGEITSLDLQYYATNGTAVIGKEKCAIVHSGPGADLSFSRKQLLVLCENGVLDKIVPYESGPGAVKISKTSSKTVKVNLKELIPKVAQDTDFLVVSSSLYEVIVVTFSYSEALTTFHHLRGSDLSLIQSLELKQQALHVHQLKLMIRKKTSYYIAITRCNYVHMFAIGKNGMVMLQPNVSIYCGPLDGACVINENEVVVFEGSKNLLMKLTLQ